MTHPQQQYYIQWVPSDDLPEFAGEVTNVEMVILDSGLDEVFVKRTTTPDYLLKGLSGVSVDDPEFAHCGSLGICKTGSTLILESTEDGWHLTGE